MDFVTCHVQWRDDPGMVTVIDRPSHALHWTEIPLIQRQHGETSVFNVELVRQEPNPSPSQEKAYLAERYPEELIEDVYPGRSPRFEFEMPSEGVLEQPVRKPRKYLKGSKETDDEV